MNRRPAYLRAQAVADRLGVTVRTVRRWIADGTLPSAKVRGTRLIAEEDLERVLGRCGVDLEVEDDDGRVEQNQSAI